MSEIESVDFGAFSRPTPEQLHALSKLHQEFALRVTELFAASLSSDCELTVKSTETRPYHNFFQPLEESAYIVALNVHPRGQALVHLDSTFIWPLIDLLVGGTGSPVDTPRDLTELEESLIIGSVRSLVQLLHDTWKPLGINPQLAGRVTITQLQRLLPPAELATQFTMLAKLPKSEGTINLLLSPSCAGALLRKLSADKPVLEFCKPKPEKNEAVQRRLLKCSFKMDLELYRARVCASEILNLHPGKIIRLSVPVSESATLLVGGRQVFRALPVRSDGQRAAHVTERLLIKQVETRS